MTQIAIVGSGLIGRSWASVFASHGFEVALFDAAPGVAHAARGHIASSLEELAGHGLVDDPKGALGRIRVADSLADVLSGAAFVQESGPETVPAKKALFAEMDAIAAPDTILASSTSFIMASTFSEGLPGARRCLVGHPVNPPHLVPVVEIAPAPWTEPAIVERAKAIYEEAGQTPVVLRKEKAGFVLNRLQAVLLAEAFRLVGEGVASAEDVDKTIRDGLGLRWAFMGPFETIELNAPGGIPDYCARYAASLDAMVKSSEGLGNPFGPSTVTEVMREWDAAPSTERVKQLSDWRDGRLAALRAHKRSAARKPE